MVINFKPQRRDESLSLEKQGDTLIVNGVPFDFSPLPDGATLPAEAIGSEWFCGPVDRISEELHLTLILPHGANPSVAAAFPEPKTITENGPVEVPK